MLSLALDFTDLREALKVAEKCFRFFDLIEVGTPLLKAEGARRCVESLGRFGLPLYLDLKTIDAGRMEAVLAEDPVRYATVLALADESTIRDFHEVCRSKGVYSVMDTIRCPLERLREIPVPVDYIGIHTGVDEQRRGEKPFSKLTLFRRLYGDKPVALAGGLSSSNIRKALPLTSQADILVVGSAVTKAEDPEREARRLREIVDEQL